MNGRTPLQLKENLNILMANLLPSTTTNNLHIAATGHDASQTLGNLLKANCQSTKNAVVNSFQPLIDNKALRKVSKAQKQKAGKQQPKSRNSSVKQKAQMLHEVLSDQQHQHFKA
jgi:hypothetical protein